MSEPTSTPLPAPPPKPAAPRVPTHPPREAARMARLVPTMPFLVYREFIAAILLTLGFMIWSLVVDSPLEEHANPNLTPNPSKAPWYFLGLQELLVYFDPWIAGVVMPTQIITGLILIPFVDVNPKGVGSWAADERPFAYTMFLFGYFLWMFFIPIGVFIRGPSWQWYWPWESFTMHKDPPAGLWDLNPWIGLVLIAAYLGGGMGAAKVLSPAFYKNLGFIRYNLVMGHLLIMFAIPLKILARLVFNIKYVFNGDLTGIGILTGFRI